MYFPACNVNIFMELPNKIFSYIITIVLYCFTKSNLNSTRRFNLKLSKLKLYNFRCFGDNEQTIMIDDITSFIGNNSSGKTAALLALNLLFSSFPSERILNRRDFHLPKGMNPDEMESQDLYIETVFTFDKLDNNEAELSIPPFFKSFVVDKPNGTPYVRIRLEAIWEKSSNIEGAIDSKIYYITCPEEEAIKDKFKTPANRRDLDRIRVMYIPAIRDPSKQLKNVSGTMMHQIMNSINWSETNQQTIIAKINELNELYLNEKGISTIGESIHTQWKSYDSDVRYSNAQLKFNSTNIESSLKKSEVTFLPTVTGKECTIDDMGDGLRSLFYISLVDSLLDIELKIQQEKVADPEHVSFNHTPPVLSIIALEEPENHIAPHLIGKLVSNLKSLAIKNNAQTVLTSHSTAIVKRIEPENLRYFRIDPSDYTTSVRSITLPSKEKLADQYKYIKEAVKAYPELYFSKLVILGEGDSEQIILPRFWETVNENIDISGISIVPLGGRHVNHFWRLLNDLRIPYITLLDLDRERDEGGWGRIKYVLKQLMKTDYSKDKILSTNNGVLSDKDFSMMHTWNANDTKGMQLWIELLERYNVFFSSPLDIDFLMLEHYDKEYRNTLTDKEGPRILVTESGQKKRKYIKEIEHDIQYLSEYKARVSEDVRHTLKECGGNGETYSEAQKKLMIWYTYFFLNRGKPSTHIEALSMISNKALLSSIPSVIQKLISRAEQILKEYSNENYQSGEVDTK